MLGERIRELRKSKKLTMKQFGQQFNLAESTISGYENGTRKPDIDLIEKFADFFDVDTDYLLGRTGVPRSAASGIAYYGGGADWTEEERKLAQAAVEDWRRRKREMEQSFLKKEQ